MKAMDLLKALLGSKLDEDIDIDNPLRGVDGLPAAASRHGRRRGRRRQHSPDAADA